jgi:hypothetical protein
LHGSIFQFNAEEAVEYQLEALKYNDQPRQDYGIEVMYRFAGFDPFERSTYFGRQFDLGQCYSSLNVSGGYFTIQLIGFCLPTKKELY